MSSSDGDGEIGDVNVSPTVFSVAMSARDRERDNEPQRSRDKEKWRLPTHLRTRRTLSSTTGPVYKQETDIRPVHHDIDARKASGQLSSLCSKDRRVQTTHMANIISVLVLTRGQIRRKLGVDQASSGPFVKRTCMEAMETKSCMSLVMHVRLLVGRKGRNVSDKIDLGSARYHLQRARLFRTKARHQQGW